MVDNEAAYYNGYRDALETVKIAIEVADAKLWDQFHLISKAELISKMVEIIREMDDDILPKDRFEVYDMADRILKNYVDEFGR